MNKEKDESLKSWILLLAGLAGIGYQQYTHQTDWMLLVVFTIMTGIPGAAQFISLIRNSPIVLQSSLPQASPSDSELPSSSTKSLEDKV